MKITRIVAVAVAVAGLAAGCSSSKNSAGTAQSSAKPAASTAPTSAAGSSPAETAAASSVAADPGKKLKIALSNSFIGNKWRIEMANVFKSACAMPPLKDKVECPVFHAGNDVAKQTQDITNLISQGVDAIVINAASPTGLNGIVKQACDKGIVVVSFDSTVSEPCAKQVNIDQKAMGAAMAKWLVDKMGGKGNVVMVTGVAGTSTDTDRNTGAEEVFNSAGIKVIAKYTGMWDSATAQRNTATQLPSLKQVDGLWVSGGTDGVLKAFKDANRKLPPTAGESENGFRKMMAAGEVEGYSTGAPPFLSAMALEMARKLVTKEIPNENITIGAPIVLNPDVAEGKTVFKDQPDSFFTTFTDGGAKPAIVLCLQAGLDGKPCDGDVKINLVPAG